jgi:GntR family transcriptional regulator
MEPTLPPGPSRPDDVLSGRRGTVHGTLGPAAEGVRARILDEIAAGSLRPGERLGAERDMAPRYGVSRSTLRLAIEALESTGHLRRARGRAGGTFVAERRVERDLTHMTGLPAYLRRQGFEAGTRVLSARLIEADDETVESLRLAPGALVFEIVRTRFADGAPISLERARLPADRFPGLLDHSLRGSVYALMQEQYGIVPGEALERIEIVGASATAARLLDVPRSSALLSVERVMVDDEGRPFELSHDLVRGDRVRIVVRADADPESPGVIARSIEAVARPTPGATKGSA